VKPGETVHLMIRNILAYSCYSRK